MKTTLLGITFEVNDLRANYEIAGTSDNYSFSYKIGRGSDLVNSLEENECSHTVDLYGNYGQFDVRVFAVSDLGIRSEFVQETITINPPTFGGTFTFGSIFVKSDEENARQTVQKIATQEDNLMIVESDFLSNEIDLEWKLNPPVGHAKEGELVSDELLIDPLFSHFNIKISNDEGQSFSVENYRDFSIKINEDLMSANSSTFSPSRGIKAEIECVDSFNNIASGVAECENDLPTLTAFAQNIQGANISFSWASDDLDFSYARVHQLTIPQETPLHDISGFFDNLDHFRNIVNADKYKALKHYSYKKGSYYIYSDGFVYYCLQNHTYSSSSDLPENNSNYWKKEVKHFDSMGYQFSDRKDYLFDTQIIWGYDNYFYFQTFDEFGEGQDYNYSNGNIITSGDLTSINTSARIENLQFRERGDDLVFSWDVVDSNGSSIDLSALKYNFSSAGLSPPTLGISGSLIDTKTKKVVASISRSDSENAEIIYKDINGNQQKLTSDSFSVLESFEYNRPLNNLIYDSDGFPEDTEDFDSDKTYTPDASPLHVLYGDDFYKIITNNKVGSDYIYPYYVNWSPSENYSIGDYFVFNENVYSVIQDFGPESDFVDRGFINELNSYSAGDKVLAPSDSSINIFRSSSAYQLNQLVLFEGEIYRCMDSQTKGNAVEPSDERGPEFWEISKKFEGFSIFRAKENITTLSALPAISNRWEVITPESSYVSSYFNKKINYYGREVVSWDEDYNFNVGQFAIYKNDVWFCSSSNSNKPPDENSSYWSNVYAGQDISTTHSEGDLVYHKGYIYKCLKDSPNGAPINASVQALAACQSDYSSSDWVPFWQTDSSYLSKVYGHIAIPEKGKRDIILSVGILSPFGNLCSQQEIYANNPAPEILRQGFSVDSTSQASRVRFNFNYKEGFQEKTTKVHLYRSSSPDFSITGSDRLPFSRVAQNSNDPSTFVKSVIGAGDATFGDNITEIFDDPPLYIGEDGLEYATGYYYKILPFDDFGSGQLYNVVDNLNDLERVIVYPKRYHSSNPSDPIGEIPKAKQPNTGPDGGIILYESIPGPVENLNGDTAFENYFLNWDIPNSQRNALNKMVFETPNDVDYYEVWESEDQYIDTGTNDYLTQSDNLSGYRKILGDLKSYGDVPVEKIDVAESITNALNIMCVDARSPSLSITHKGGVNDKRYFWIRPVDFAGNKGPFTGARDFNGEYLQGTGLILGQAKTTDLADFEQNLSEAFPNTLTLVPNDPFKDNHPNANEISWSEHFAYYNGTGYVIAGGSTDKSYIYWSATGKNETHGYDVVELTENQKIDLNLIGPGGGPVDNGKENPLRNLVYSGRYNPLDYHPAGEGDGGTPDQQKPSMLGEKHDFIVARNSNGLAVNMWHSFANAAIGTAHIQNAAITNAKIHNLVADKIKAGTIAGQDIQLLTSDNQGQIRSYDFGGINSKDQYGNYQQGFAISGDGSFVFQGLEGSLYFDDGTLTLEGDFRQKDGREYTFLDLSAQPNSFFYVEQSDGSYVPGDNSPVSLFAQFQNTTIEKEELRWRIDKVVQGVSYPVFGYGEGRDSDGNVNISGFTYNVSDFNGQASVRTAKAQLSVNGFDDIINSVNPPIDTIIVYCSGERISMERSETINFVADGAAAVYVELHADKQIYKYDFDKKFITTDQPNVLNLTATPYNVYGELEYIFSTGKTIGTLEEIARKSTPTHTISNLSQEIGHHDITPVIAHVGISGVHNTEVIASDFVTVYGALPGKDSYTVLLSNENVTFPADEYGKISPADFARGATDVEMYRGYEKYAYKSDSNDSLSYDVTSVSSNPSKLGFAESFFTDSNGKTQYRLTVNQFDDIDEGKITLTIGDNGYKGTNDAINFEKIYTVNKSYAGAKGRVVEIIPESFIVQYDTEGQIRSNQNININFTHRNFETSTPRFTFISGSTTIQNYISSSNPNNSSFVFEPPATYADGRSTSFEVKAYDQRSTDNTWFEAAKDIVTIHGVKDNSNALTFIQTNPHANIPLNFRANDELSMPNGINDYVNNVIGVFEGETQLTFDKNATSDSDLSNGEFRVNVIEGHNGFVYNTKNIYSSSNNQDPLRNKAASFTDFNVANWTSSSWLNTIQTFLIRARDSDGKIRNSTQVQTISTKSDGRNARSVELSSTQTVFRYKTNGSLSTGNGAEAIISVDILNAIPNATYYLTYKSDKSNVFSVGNGSTWHSALSTEGTYTANHTANNRRVKFSAPSTYEPGGNYNIPATLTVELREVSGTNTDPLAIDMITMNPLKDGADTITPLLTNQHVAVSLDSDGNLFGTPVLFTNTFASLYHGSSPFIYKKVSSTNDLNNNEYYITRTISKSDGLNNDFTDGGTNGIHSSSSILEELTSWRNGVISAERKVTFHYKTNEGLVGSVELSQTFSTSKQGDVGDPGADGDDGDDGQTPTFMGLYNDSTEYFGEIGGRGDIVKYGDEYYICIQNNSESNKKNPDNTEYWKPFGSQFKSIATDLLLTENAFINRRLQLGVGANSLSEAGSGVITSSDFVGGLYDFSKEGSDYQPSPVSAEVYKIDFPTNYDLLDNYNSDYDYWLAKVDEYGNDVAIADQDTMNDIIELGSPVNTDITIEEYSRLPSITSVRRRGASVIASLGKDIYQPELNNYGTPGFALARLYDDGAQAPFVVFDIGGKTASNEDSYLRFNSLNGKIEIKGAFIDNSVQDVTITEGSTQSSDALSYFIGGGYNNTLISSTAQTSTSFNSLGSAIVGGAYNRIAGKYSFVGNGFNNDVNDNYSSIVGGYKNQMPDFQLDNAGANFVGGGQLNIISGNSNQSVLGGSFNEIKYDSNSEELIGSDANAYTGILNPEFYIGQPKYGITDNDPIYTFTGVATLIGVNLSAPRGDSPTIGFWGYCFDLFDSNLSQVWVYFSLFEYYVSGNKRSRVWSFHNVGSNSAWVFYDPNPESSTITEDGVFLYVQVSAGWGGHSGGWIFVRKNGDTFYNYMTEMNHNLGDYLGNPPVS